MIDKKEVWLRGPIPNVLPLLQPVAHALLQANEEVKQLTQELPHNKLWVKPYGLASAGFHLQHLSGVINRLFTYAQGKQLSEEQIAFLNSEGVANSSLTVVHLVDAFSRQIECAITQLQGEVETELTATRGVGRANIPSTTIGLYVHAAEHTMRHLGQMLVTIRCVSGEII